MAKPNDQPPPYSEAASIPGVHYPGTAPPMYQPASSAYQPVFQQPGYQPNYPNPYQTPPPAGFVPTYGATNIIITPPVIAVGACPACHVGILDDDFTCLGIMCAILFFPLGILCCLALKNRRCSNCGAYFA